MEIKDFLQQDLSQVPLEEVVNTVGSAIQGQEMMQKVLGKLASEVVNRQGFKSLDWLAGQLKETYGIKRTTNSLVQYYSVYKKLEPIMDKIPEDFSYSAWRNLASTDNPEAILDHALTEGLSSAELSRLIKGDRPKRVCPHCGQFL